MGESTDQIRQEIDQHRTSAAARIDQLQRQVEGTAEGLRSDVQDTAEGLITGVQDTAEQVREQVSGVVDDTLQSVKENFDLRQTIEQRPLVALGAALIGGFVLGGLTDDGGNRQHSSHGGVSTGSHSGGGSGSQLGSSLRSAIQKTGIEDTISSAAAAFIGSLGDQLKDTVDRNMPGFADKMQSAKETPGTFADKARETQSPGA
jgi:uncharacterized protein YjbJ (UPF0337 family)